MSDASSALKPISTGKSKKKSKVEKTVKGKTEKKSGEAMVSSRSGKTGKTEDKSASKTATAGKPKAFSLQEKIDLCIEVEARNGWAPVYGKGTWETIRQGFLSKHPERGSVAVNGLRQCMDRLVDAWLVNEKRAKMLSGVNEASNAQLTALLDKMAPLFRPDASELKKRGRDLEQAALEGMKKQKPASDSEGLSSDDTPLPVRKRRASTQPTAAGQDIAGTIATAVQSVFKNFPEDNPLEKSMAQFVETQKVANENLSNALAELSRSQAALTQFLLQRENQSS